MAATEKPYVCTLSPELVQKAEKELNERAQWRSRDVQALRDMLKKQTGIHVRLDDSYLLRFLRARKFDYDRAFDLLMRHFKMKAENPEIFDNLKPSAVKTVLDDGVTGVLDHTDRDGRKVVIFRPGKWDTERYSIQDVFRNNICTFTKLIEDEDTQVCGIIMIIDMKDISWAHAKSMSPFYAKRISSLLQDAFPARFKGMHYVNQPTFFDYIFAIVRQFMKEKLVSRLHFHGSRVEELAEFVDPEYLPEEYGGKGPPWSNKVWAEKLLKCDADFDADSKYGLVGNKPVQSTNKSDAMESLSGTFRKLDC
ncbi:hypothetical protein ScPMuIL_009142 [Solemya velum]